MPVQLRAIAAATAFALLAANPAGAQDAVEQFFRGKTISVVIGSAAGGGYDVYARLVSRYQPPT